MNLVIVGSVALDSIKTPYGEVKMALGGSAVYAGIAASHFTKPRIVGVVGEDFPRKHIDLLENHGINLDGLQIIPGGKTFHWEGFYEGDMEQAYTLDTRLNVFEHFQPNLPEHYKDAEFLFLANIDPALQLHVLNQVENPKMVVTDTMNFWIEGKRDELLQVLEKSDVVVVNDEESFLLTTERNLLRAAEKILDYGCGSVIIKQGMHGAIMLSRDDYFTVPGYLLKELKDTTGAGDTFAGGFIGYLASKERITKSNIRRAMVLGCVLSSFVCEEFSVKGTAELTKEKFFSRCDEFYRFSRVPRVSI